MKKMKIALFMIFSFAVLQASAKDYCVDDFGSVPDGQTDNTARIQAAIDYISENGGGRLVFPLGRYVSGTLVMRSNVTLHLEDGVVLLGSLNPMDYHKDALNLSTALLIANNVENFGVTGKGTIDLRGRQVAYRLVAMIHRGVVKDPLGADRPVESIRPMIIYFRECKNIKIEGIRLVNSGSWVQTYDQCDNLHVNDIYVESNAYWNNDGIDIVDCTNSSVRNSYFDAADDAICLKSHSGDHMCRNVLIRDNVARSGASGIKFGTVSAGGFVDITLINNKVYDTFRSALALEAVDGGKLENVFIDSLYAVNVGNVIFLRTGKRWGPDRLSSLKNVTIQNVWGDVPAGKPDAGYDYEGPIGDQPRNISASIIAGHSDMLIENVTLRNVHITHPGGAKPFYAYRELAPAALDSMPELREGYPEFSRHRETPGWGFYIRHARNITFENVTLTALTPDYRPAIVTDDLVGFRLNGTKLEEADAAPEEQIYIYKTSDVTIDGKPFTGHIIQ